LWGGARGGGPVVPPRETPLPVPRGAPERMSAKIVYRGPIAAPVASGAEVARLQVFRGQTMVMETPLVTAEAVETGTLSQRAMDSAVELGRNLIKDGFRSITRKDDAKP